MTTEINNELPTRYDPQATEAAIYERWLQAGCFRATPDDRPPYCITVPPPNITGALHLGHALNHTIMDVLGRWKRMSGYNTLILPGTDHGGISTQSVVENPSARKNCRGTIWAAKNLSSVWRNGRAIMARPF